MRISTDGSQVIKLCVVDAGNVVISAIQIVVLYDVKSRILSDSIECNLLSG